MATAKTAKKNGDVDTEAGAQAFRAISPCRIDKKKYGPLGTDRNRVWRGTMQQYMELPEPVRVCLSLMTEAEARKIVKDEQSSQLQNLQIQFTRKKREQVQLAAELEAVTMQKEAQLQSVKAEVKNLEIQVKQAKALAAKTGVEEVEDEEEPDTEPDDGDEDGDTDGDGEVDEDEAEAQAAILFAGLSDLQVAELRKAGYADRKSLESAGPDKWRQVRGIGPAAVDLISSNLAG